MKKTKKFIKQKIIIITSIILMCLAGIILTKSWYQKTIHITTTTGTTPSNTYQGIISLEIIGPEEEPKNEQRIYAPAKINNIIQEKGITTLTLDMLSLNPDFQPGITDFFINQNPKLRNIAISKNTKAFNCNGNVPDISVPVADVIATIQQQLTNNNERLIYYFDIDDGTITSIYEQCLP